MTRWRAEGGGAAPLRCVLLQATLLPKLQMMRTLLAQPHGRPQLGAASALEPLHETTTGKQAGYLPHASKLTSAVCMLQR